MALTSRRLNISRFSARSLKIWIIAMPEVEILSAGRSAVFPEGWFDMADDDHFWIRWRFAALLQAVRKLGLDTTSPLLGLDIGCGHGAMLRKLITHTAWRADGCDLNKTALSLSSGHSGRVLYYDINDRSPDFHE